MEGTAVRYCWLCDKPVEQRTGRADVHYETGRAVFFCSPCHWDEYRWLRAL